MGLDGVKREACHCPVLTSKILDILQPDRLRFFIDCTVGEGGHLEAMASKMAQDSVAAGLDRDGEIIQIAKHRLEKFGDRVRLFTGSYRDMGEIVEKVGIGPADGILLDLGLSSYHIASPRGFSFMEGSALDMRFDREEEVKSACDMVNEMSQKELEDVLRQFGEERKARRIAGAIVSARKKSRIGTTEELAEIVSKAVGRSGRIHPATRTFQALRIKVNMELEHVSDVMSVIPGQLAPGGRVAVISYHSMEDRIVKRAMRGWEEEGLCSTLFKKPVMASDEEVEANPRSRSARLRAAERTVSNN